MAMRHARRMAAKHHGFSSASCEATGDSHNTLTLFRPWCPQPSHKIMNQAFRSYLAEFIGTFTLVFVGTAVATLQGLYQHGSVGFLEISMAFGFTLMVLVWVLGPVSGCHINPAVTL